MDEKKTMASNLAKYGFTLVFGIGILVASNFYVIPKLQQQMGNGGPNVVSEKIKSLPTSLQPPASETLQQTSKPVYSHQTHEGYTKRKADIRTCANEQCTVVGRMPKGSFVKWQGEENGFIKYDSVYYIKLADVKLNK